MMVQLILSCRALSSPTLCRFIPALSGRPTLLPPKSWSWNSWKGFYTKLQKELQDGNWDYVANPSGGFIGYWWYSQGDNECEQYLQLEQDRFCFKIWVADAAKRRSLREYWYKRIVDECSVHGIKAKRPDRFGNGEYMTVSVLDQEFPIVGANGRLDIMETLNIIHSAESVLDTWCHVMNRGRRGESVFLEKQDGIADNYLFERFWHNYCKILIKYDETAIPFIAETWLTPL